MKKVAILPLDGFSSAKELLDALKDLLDKPGLSDLISHIKLNDGIHNLDRGGPTIIGSIKEILKERNLSIEIFLDLKITDVSGTVINTLKKYNSVMSCPDILTVTSLVAAESLLKLRQLLPDTKLAMVSVLTDMSAEECLSRFGQAPEVKLYNDLMNMRQFYQKNIRVGENREPYDLVVCSKDELSFLKRNLPESYGFIVPGIRDVWMLGVKNEHQKRISGVKWALNAGATYVVLGAQITKGNPENGISAEESRQLTFSEIMSSQVMQITEDPLEVLKNCGGYYLSPKDDRGKFLGPLVTYAGTYPTDNGSKHFVGLEYYDFAFAEVYPLIRNYFAKLIGEEIFSANLVPDYFLGAAMGGVKLAEALGENLLLPSIFTEKKVIVAENAELNIKEESRQLIKRHHFPKGSKIILVEDVVNNSSTTEKIKIEIEKKGGKLIAIVCAFNRSGKSEWNGIPILTSYYVPTPQFRQDDVLVADLVAAGNVSLDPKGDFEHLKSLM